jgi:uncharacterized membrane protein
MKVQFTHPEYLFLLLPALAWIGWLAWKSDVHAPKWRRIGGTAIRIIIVVCLCLALAGFQWLHPREGMNVFFVLDRSESIPAGQEENAREFVNRASATKKDQDRGGVVVFGSDAALEHTPEPVVQVHKIQAVVDSQRTDIAAAVRLASAAFPENGQKRIVLATDGNENSGDVLGAIMAARPLGVTVDILPLGVARANDVAVQKLAIPTQVKKGQTFDVKIFAQADVAQAATVRLYRNNQPLGEQRVELSQGKNLFSFPQTLEEPGFYSYSLHLDAPNDLLPQNNRASGYTTVQGIPRVLIISSDPVQDEALAVALRSAKLDVHLSGLQFPSSFAELQSYDSIFLSNVAAGDLGREVMNFIESAVRDFGVGLVCIGGDQAYAAGGYRSTPLETTLPVEMELSSKKVLPSGAVALIMHGMEFMNGNAVARDCAIGVLDSLGPQDEMGVVLWDGTEKWLFPMTKVGNKKELGRLIAGMNQGDLPHFNGVMTRAYQGLKNSKANLKHMIVFSDGDPGAPSASLMQSIVGDRITVTTVLIAGHAGPETMMWIADQGRGRFYDVRSPAQLPQIFVKEAAVILKSAIYEEPFTPQLASFSEVLQGIGRAEYPQLLGYVATTPKPRAQTPLLTDKGDPLLAHWQYGLGRSVAFTSDAKAKWANPWLNWDKYRQFWTQVARWSLRKVDNADFTTDVNVENGAGHLAVEALDPQGNFRNFLDLKAVVVSPKGEKLNVQLEQTGPGRYEARFPTKEVGSYRMNLMEVQNGEVKASQVVGASINYSPEFAANEPNLPLLRRMAELGNGKLLDPTVDNPFHLNRQKSFRPQDLWEQLLIAAIFLFLVDVAVRRIYIDREEWAKATANLRKALFFWRPAPVAKAPDDSLAALLNRRDQVRSRQPVPTERPDLFQPEKPAPTPSTAPSMILGDSRRPSAPGPSVPASTSVPSEKNAATPGEQDTTSRLLAAKRRAQRKNE